MFSRRLSAHRAISALHKTNSTNHRAVNTQWRYSREMLTCQLPQIRDGSRGGSSFQDLMLYFVPSPTVSPFPHPHPIHPPIQSPLPIDQLNPSLGQFSSPISLLHCLCGSGFLFKRVITYSCRLKMMQCRKHFSRSGCVSQSFNFSSQKSSIWGKNIHSTVGD